MRTVTRPYSSRFITAGGTGAPAPSMRPGSNVPESSSWPAAARGMGQDPRGAPRWPRTSAGRCPCCAAQRGPGQALRSNRPVRRRSAAGIRILADAFPPAVEAKAKICITLWFPAPSTSLPAGELFSQCGGALPSIRTDQTPAW